MLPLRAATALTGATRCEGSPRPLPPAAVGTCVPGPAGAAGLLADCDVQYQIPAPIRTMAMSKPRISRRLPERRGKGAATTERSLFRSLIGDMSFMVGTAKAGQRLSR